MDATETTATPRILIFNAVPFLPQSLRDNQSAVQWFWRANNLARGTKPCTSTKPLLAHTARYMGIYVFSSVRTISSSRAAR